MIRKTHVSNFGLWADTLSAYADGAGFVKFSDSRRFSEAPLHVLERLRKEGSPLTRASAAVEIAKRKVAAWRRANS